MYKIAVFVSGRGSNVRSVFESVPKDLLKISALVSDKSDCGAVSFAIENKIPVFLVSTKQIDGFISYNLVVDKLKEYSVDLIVLAGFLKKIPDFFVDQFEGKIINIHPALLPSFGGKGMYGMNVHRAVFDFSCKVSGVTIHYVDKVYDHGKIIAQRAVDISGCNSPVEIAENVLVVEHKLLPYVVQKFAQNKISLINNRVVIAD